MHRLNLWPLHFKSTVRNKRHWNRFSWTSISCWPVVWSNCDPISIFEFVQCLIYIAKSHHHPGINNIFVDTVWFHFSSLDRHAYIKWLNACTGWHTSNWINIVTSIDAAASFQVKYATFIGWMPFQIDDDNTTALTMCSAMFCVWQETRWRDLHTLLIYNDTNNVDIGLVGWLLHKILMKSFPSAQNSS